jgi:hypothetical protein
MDWGLRHIIVVSIGGRWDKKWGEKICDKKLDF